MHYNLNEIFKAIVPDNIKGLAIVLDTMKIFNTLLEERAKESLDIGEIFKNNKKVKTELFKTYLGDLYEVLDNIKDNQKMDKLIENRNAIYEGDNPNYEFISRKILDNMIDHISEEHYIAFRNFRENKGTIKGVEYAFELISSLVNTPEDIQYVVLAGGDPFDLSIDGTLPYEFYQYLIAPLAHPAGFTFDYSRTMEIELIDYFFPVDIEYNVRDLKVVCKTIDPVGTLINVTGTTDLSDREVTHIVRDDFHWPRIFRVYFGGEHEGEYLENEIDLDGKSRVQIKDSSGNVIHDFNGLCSQSGCNTCVVESNIEIKVIRKFSEGVFDREFFTDIIFALKDIADDYEDGPFFTDIKPFDAPTTYLSWNMIPFWERVGVKSYKKDILVDEEYDEHVLGEHYYENYLIGAEHMYVWGKLEDLKPQHLREFQNLDDVPDRINPFDDDMNPPTTVQELYGMTPFKGERMILRDPHNPDNDVLYISGDAYSVQYTSGVGEDGINNDDSNNRGFWENRFHQFSDDFGFSVYRDDELLEDNNMKMLNVVYDDFHIYMGFDKIPFWKAIGDYSFQLNKDENGDYGDLHIGDEFLYISGKLEYTEDQYNRGRFTNNLYDRFDPYEDPNFSGTIIDSQIITYGTTEINNKKALLVNPFKPNKSDAYISGDAYFISFLNGVNDIIDGTKEFYDPDTNTVIEMEVELGLWYNAFDQHSDNKEFGFDVYRDDVYLSDNNISALD